MNNWQWTGTDGQTKRGISELRARSLVACRGGEAAELPEMEPIFQSSAVLEYRSASGDESSAVEAYGRNRFNGD